MSGKSDPVWKCSDWLGQGSDYGPCRILVGYLSDTCRIPVGYLSDTRYKWTKHHKQGIIKCHVTSQTYKCHIISHYITLYHIQQGISHIWFRPIPCVARIHYESLRHTAPFLWSRVPFRYNF